VGIRKCPRLNLATSAALSAATCGVLTRFASSRPRGLGHDIRMCLEDNPAGSAGQGGIAPDGHFLGGAMGEWRDNLIDDDAGIRTLLAETRRIAVLGIKPESHSFQPAYYVPAYMKAAGYEVVPVPVYYPELREILGEPVYRRLEDVPGEIDLVDVFRRPRDIDAHVEDIVAKRPKAVWFQSGIRNEAAARTLAEAGIRVVQDRCLMIDHRRLGR
jgi:uncharacterized protein